MPTRSAISSRRRGTAYVLALSIMTILMIVGIAATKIARTELAKSTLESDQAVARLSAIYTQDYIHRVLSGGTAWRASAPNASWNIFYQYQGCTMYYAYVDQVDGNINNDATQPFLLYTLAVKGNSRRIYRVEIVPDANGNLTRNADTFQQLMIEDL